MKFILATAIASLASPLANASPLAIRQSSSDTENGWSGILNGDSGASCADLAVIFARGTFDSGYVNVIAPGRQITRSWLTLTSQKHRSLGWRSLERRPTIQA